MNEEKINAAKISGVNLANCYHLDEHTNFNVCGAMAVWHMPMPGNLPDMPLCSRHKGFYEDFTEDDIMEIVLEQMSDYESGIEEDYDS